MKIQAKNKIKGLDGKDLDLTVGQAISNILVSSETGGKMKLFVLAQKFYNDNVVDIDAADVELTKNTIESSKVYTALVSGQLLVLIDSLKDEDKQKDKKAD